MILVIDSKGLERILVGKGIAFGKKAGSIIQNEMIEKTFVVDSPNITDRFVQLIEEVPVNRLEMVTLIVRNAEDELQRNFDEMTYIGLADHINYAVNRYRKNQIIKNALLVEIKKFYPKEFLAGMHALETIAYYEGIELTNDEAGFIALHFVNGAQGNTASQTLMTTEILQKVLLIVEDTLSVTLDEESLNYLRFVTHLKFFLQRITTNDFREESIPEMFEQVITFYPRATQCVQIIKQYVEDKLHTVIYPEEQMYLILHIQRLLK